MSSDVNGPWSYVNIHEVVNYSALNVAFVLVDEYFLASIKYLDKAIIGLGLFFDCLVLSFIVL